MNGEIQLLLDKARRYIHSAALLRADGDFDSACSRLYYAMFYCTEALLDTRRLEHSSHRAVISGFGNISSRRVSCPRKCTNGCAKPSTNVKQAITHRRRGLTEADALDLESKATRFIEQTEQFLKSHGHL